MNIEINSNILNYDNISKYTGYIILFYEFNSFKIQYIIKEEG